MLFFLKGWQSKSVWKQHSTIERNAPTSATLKSFPQHTGTSASPIPFFPGKQFKGFMLWSLLNHGRDCTWAYSTLEALVKRGDTFFPSSRHPYTLLTRAKESSTDCPILNYTGSVGPHGLH